MTATVLNKSDRVVILYALRLYENKIREALELNSDPEVVNYYMKKEEKIGALRERLKRY